MYPLMYLFGKNSMPDVDNLITSFYQLDDEARQEVVETIRLKLDVYKRQIVYLLQFRLQYLQVHEVW